MNRKRLITNASTEKRLLVTLDDDPLFNKIINYQLQTNGFRCKSFSNAGAMFDDVSSNGTPNIFILDYDLGNSWQSGLDVCRKVKAHYEAIPVIMLTADDATETVISCLNAGAEQYIIKPYDLRELLARIEVVSRLSERQKMMREHHSDLNRKGDKPFKLDWNTLELEGANGARVELSEKEAALMELFMARSDSHVERDSAFLSIYGYEREPMNRSIDVLISRLRKKISLISCGFDITTIRGRGYLLSITAENSTVNANESTTSIKSPRRAESAKN